MLENSLYYIKTKKIDPMAKWIVFGMVAFVVRHLLLKNVGLKVPGASPILESARTISHFSDMGNNFSNAYLSLVGFFSANFWGMKLEWALPSLYFSIALFLALYLQAKYSFEIYKEKSSDENRFMVFLLLGSLSILGLQLFSQISATHRYIVGTFINGLVILGHWLNTKWPSGKKLSIIFIATFAASIAYQVSHHRYKKNPLLKERQEIAKAIRAEHLNNGYAWFGNALSTNFILNEQRVATLDYKSNYPMLWLIDRNTFYRPGKFDFIIAWKDGKNGDWGEYDLNDDEIRKYFGTPEKTIEIGRARIYVYDDITDKVKKPELKALGFSK
jgi:hypothetical protein